MRLLQYQNGLSIRHFHNATFTSIGSHMEDGNKTLFALFPSLCRYIMVSVYLFQAVLPRSSLHLISWLLVSLLFILKVKSYLPLDIFTVNSKSSINTISNLTTLWSEVHICIFQRSFSTCSLPHTEGISFFCRKVQRFVYLLWQECLEMHMEYSNIPNIKRLLWWSLLLLK